MAIARSALIISTTPPFPREYGNRNRVFQTSEFLGKMGYRLSFLLYALDEEWARTIPSYYRDLVNRFEYFSAIPNTKLLHQNALGNHHEIDEWWDDSITKHLSWLVKRKHYDIVFVNYTFLSKAFTIVPEKMLRILDTHDIFTGRREVFEKHGVAPEFFYTTAEQEQIAFERSDIILGIKSSESKFIRSLTKRTVVTLPYWDSKPTEIPNIVRDETIVFSHERPLKLGFIGAQNSVNVINMQRFLELFRKYLKIYNLPVVVLIAGNVCRKLNKEYTFVQKIGYVQSIGDFYRQVDAIIAPLEFSTGIKIKVGEALLWNIPVLATRNAFDGFKPYHGTQTEKSVSSLCESIADLATNQICYMELAEAARRAGWAAANAQENGLEELRSHIRSRTKETLFVTDRSYWYRETFFDEAIAQAVEYLSDIGPLIVANIGSQSVDADAALASAEYVLLDNFSGLDNLIMEIMEFRELSSVVLFLEGDYASHLRERIKLRNLTVFDFQWLRKECYVLKWRSSDDDQSFRLAPLRYLPLTNRRISARAVLVMRPADWTEWEALIYKYLEDCCRELKIRMESISVPVFGECDRDYMRRYLESQADSIVVFGSDKVSAAFVVETSRYRSVRLMIVGCDYLFPEYISQSTMGASVQKSIDRFLTDDSAGRVAAGTDYGWSSLWTALKAKLSS